MNLVWIFVGIQILGVVCAVVALFHVRTPQGTVAWVVSLLTIPAVAIPAYLLFGRRRFVGYVLARRRHLREMAAEAQVVADRYVARGYIAPPESSDDKLLVRIARLPFTVGNEVELLVDGERTFRSLLEGIERARKYVLVQFYILRDDGLGRELADLLVAKAKAGVRVFVIYDEVGSADLPDAYVVRIRAAGGTVVPFNARKGRANRFQVNFRNHRKLVVVDGCEAWAGGLNIGDEYLGKDREMGAWRDTHVRVRGPVVTTIQIPFLEDWHWATGAGLELTWETEAASKPGVRALCLPTGPADEEETCSLFFTALIHAARERLWIATPYFVPDSAVMGALVLAAWRGVDVRILLPYKSDHRLVWLARFAYVETCERAGIRLLEYGKAFMHQKVVVVDDRFATIGTANLDNRSLRLNFELTVLFDDPAFAREVAAMLERDMEGAAPITVASFRERGIIFGIGVRLANLFAPIL